MQKLRIYGDNILECEKTLDLIYKSIKINTVNSTIILKFDFKSNIFCPLYIIQSSNDNKGLFEIQLFAGYNRWTSNILDKLTSLGSSLNEGADSIVTQLMDDREEILFGCEYCGALPAGNNAWQRSGRALLLLKQNTFLILFRNRWYGIRF
ncbi:hypothetical protein [Metaclostridioides mangenotii]|uniref:hypothetical protein n=1 Tax=Metaclostridioides mangenotii TaxID=1540 RepID=UPI0004648353|nr:hypothetical protein [Clostridioides mangenotii]